MMMGHRIIYDFGQFLSILNSNFKYQQIVMQVYKDIILNLPRYHFISFYIFCNSLNPELNYIDNLKMQEKFDGSSQKQGKVTFTPRKIINLYTVYKKNLWPYNDGTSFTLGIVYLSLASWLRAMTLLSFVILDMILHLMHTELFWLSDGSGLNRNVKIFGINNSPSAHIHNRRKDILFLGKDLTLGLDDTLLTARGGFPNSFNDQKKKFFNGNYNGSNGFCL